MTRPTAYDGVDNLGKRQKETPQEKHQREILQDNFFNCFNTEAGKKVMEHLEKVFLLQPVAEADYGLNGIPKAYAREGENNLIRYIKRLIKESETRRK